MFDRDNARITFISVAEAIIPPAGMIEHFKDRHWIVDSERGLIFYNTSPQCNSDQRIVESLREDLYPWAEVVFIASVFRKIRLHDYC